jgi:hypothetical protein
MRKGTIDVRAALPSTANHITDKQIQESLWHYYYDVEKTVKYLVSTIAKAQKVPYKANGSKAKGGSISFKDFKSGGQPACGSSLGAFGGGFILLSLLKVQECLLNLRTTRPT